MTNERYRSDKREVLPLRRRDVLALPQLPPEHREDVFPIAIGGALVENIAVRQRIAVHGAGMHDGAVFHVARTREQLAERLDGRRRGESVLLGKAAVDFAAHPVDEAVL